MSRLYAPTVPAAPIQAWISETIVAHQLGHHPYQPWSQTRAYRQLAQRAGKGMGEKTITRLMEATTISLWVADRAAVALGTSIDALWDLRDIDNEMAERFTPRRKYVRHEQAA